MNDSNKEFRSRTAKRGLVTLITALVLLAALILINLAVALLPADIKGLDMTSNKRYSLSEETKRDIARIDTPVKISMIAVGGEAALADEGVHLDTFLKNLAAVNKNISYSLVDPLVETTFLDNYNFGSESVNDLSIIVESDLRYRHVPYSDIFGYYIDEIGKINTSDLYYYLYYGLTPYYGFAGESLLLGAINYVTNEELPMLYTLSGHSETELATTLQEQLDTANIQLDSLTLSSTDAVPSDCDLLIINAPQSDLTSSEAEVLCSYLKNGGAILLMTPPDISLLPNLCQVAAVMGLSPEDGIIIEGDGNYYYTLQSSGYPYYLVPEVNDHATTEGDLNVILPYAHGIAVSDSLSEDIDISILFNTSSEAYILPTDAETIDKPEGAENRSFCVGAAAENTKGGKLIWIPSNGLCNDTMNQVVSGGNYAFFQACVTWICGQIETSSSEPLPMVTATLTVSEGAAGLWSTILIFIIPLLFIGLGLVYIIRRKRR